MRLKALNHCKNNQNFLFIIIITRIFQGFSEKNMYFCIINFDPEWASQNLQNGGPSSVTYQFGVNLKF